MINFFPPSLIFESEMLEAGRGRTYFHALLPVIVINPVHSEALLKHELFHVKQYYAMLIVPFAILLRTKWGSFRIEAAAYGHAMKYADNKEQYLISSANTLAGDMYKHGRSFEQCKEQIKKKYIKGGLL
jgi:hypothetical protein